MTYTNGQWGATNETRYENQHKLRSAEALMLLFFAAAKGHEFTGNPLDQDPVTVEEAVIADTSLAQEAARAFLAKPNNLKNLQEMKPKTPFELWGYSHDFLKSVTLKNGIELSQEIDRRKNAPRP